MFLCVNISQPCQPHTFSTFLRSFIYPWNIANCIFPAERKDRFEFRSIWLLSLCRGAGLSLLRKRSSAKKTALVLYLRATQEFVLMNNIAWRVAQFYIHSPGRPLFAIKWTIVRVIKTNSLLMQLKKNTLENQMTESSCTRKMKHLSEKGWKTIEIHMEWDWWSHTFETASYYTEVSFRPLGNMLVKKWPNVSWNSCCSSVCPDTPTLPKKWWWWWTQRSPWPITPHCPWQPPHAPSNYCWHADLVVCSFKARLHAKNKSNATEARWKSFRLENRKSISLIFHWDKLHYGNLGQDFPHIVLVKTHLLDIKINNSGRRMRALHVWVSWLCMFWEGM